MELMKNSNRYKSLCKVIFYRANSQNRKCFFSLPAIVGLASSITFASYDEETGVSYESDEVVNNWSGTFSFRPSRLYEPKSFQELCRLTQQMSTQRKKLRPLGAALSPNGIALGQSFEYAVSLSHLDYVFVDPKRLEVTAGAGAKVGQVLQELKKYNLTLENFSAIQEQALGGWTQVAAHGTGSKFPTVEEQIVRMQIITPSCGTLRLSPQDYPQLFSLAKVGLGSLGIVSEVTLRCIPETYLKESSLSYHIDEIQNGHIQRLKAHRHVRYLWYPYADRMASIVCDAVPTPNSNANSNLYQSPKNEISRDLTPMQALAKKYFPMSPSSWSLSIPQLREALLDKAPLDLEASILLLLSTVTYINVFSPSS